MYSFGEHTFGVVTDMELESREYNASCASASEIFCPGAKGVASPVGSNNNNNGAASAHQAKGSCHSEVIASRPSSLNALQLARKRAKKAASDVRAYQQYYKQDEDGDTMLHMLIARETFKQAFFVIGITPNPKYLNMQNCDFLAPLHLAVLEREPLLCRALILAGASLRVQSATGNTPLHVACKNADFACAKALTEPLTPKEVNYLVKKSKRVSRSKRDFDIPNYEGLTSLHIAVSKGLLDVVDQLVRCGADVRAKEGHAGMSSLHFAVYHGRREIARYLAQEDPEVLEQPTMAGLTPYQMALSYDQKIADDLRQLGACTNAPSDEDSVRQTDDDETDREF